MTVHTNLSFIRANDESYTRCHEILGLPDTVEWSKLNVEFGADDFGSVTLVLIPSGEQVRDLAELAILHIQSSCASDNAGYAHSDPPEG